MKSFKRLCNAVRAISPYGVISISGAPHPVTGDGDNWRGSVSVGGVILVENVGDFDAVLEELTKKIEKMGKRVVDGLNSPSDPPPRNEEDD